MNNSRANLEDTQVQSGYGDEYNHESGARPVGSGEPTIADVVHVSSGLCDELEEGRMLVGLRRWSDLPDRRKISLS